MYKKYLAFILVLFLSACQNATSPSLALEETNHEESPTSIDANQCLLPLFPSAYPQGENVLPPPELPKTISDDWLFIASISETHLQGNEAVLALLRPATDQDEIWLYLEENYRLQEFLVYQTESQTLKHRIDTPFLQTSSSEQILFLANDNSIWLGGRSTSPNEALLYLFDEQANKFTPVFDRTNLLSEKAVLDVKVDENNVFWLHLTEIPQGSAAYEDEIVSYDPSTQEATLHFKGVGLLDIEIGPDNNLFWVEATPEEKSVIEYSYKTKDQDTHKLPLTAQQGLYELYFDAATNHLWVSDTGWFDIANQWQWYTLFRSPLFVQYIPTQGIYRWGQPHLELVQDGKIWFSSSYRGNAWLDLTTGQWCLYTNEASTIVEDSKHKLWQLFEGALYRRD